MSFGFLTESALLPSKSKPIRVDGRSLVDLKAVVYAKEQKVKLEGGGSGSGGLRGLRGKRRAAGDGGDRGERKDPFARSNRGVEDRSQRDELERVTASKKRKAAQRVMAAKSSLYEKMAKGEVAGVSRAGSLVDFSRKTGDDLALLEAKAREPKSRRSNKKGDGKPGPDLDTDDDNDDDDFSGARSKSGKKRQRSGRGSGSGSGGKRRGGGERSDSGGDDDGVGGRGGYFSDDDGGDGGGYGGFGAEVEIVDEFGRHRTVARGSREHREHLQAKKRAAEAKAEQQQQQQQSERAAGTAGSASSSFDDRYSYRGNRGAPPPPPPPPPPAGGSSSSSYTASASGGSDRAAAAAAAPPGDWAWSSGAGRGADAGDFETREGQDRQAKKGMAELLQREGAGGDEGGKGEGGAKILSQWEKTLTGDQKTYLREVQRETEAGRRKATAASGDRKTDREKQRSERKELLRRKQEARATRLRESA